MYVVFDDEHVFAVATDAETAKRHIDAEFEAEDGDEWQYNEKRDTWSRSVFLIRPVQVLD